MTDLTPEREAEWRKDAVVKGYAPWTRILVLLDALRDERTAREEACEQLQAAKDRARESQRDHDDQCESWYEEGAHAWTPCGCWASRADLADMTRQRDEAEEATGRVAGHWRVARRELSALRAHIETLHPRAVMPEHHKWLAPGGICRTCHVEWPCPTVAALSPTDPTKEGE